MGDTAREFDMLVKPLRRLIGGVLAVAALSGAAPPKLDVRIEKEAGVGNLLTLDLSGVVGTTVTGTPPPPRIWIEEAFAGTVTTERPSCEARVSRLSQTSGLQAPVRDFNVMHVATLTGKGIHVLDPRGGLRGARSLAFVDFGGRPDQWLWSERGGRIWATLPSTQELVAVDAGSWRVARRLTGLGRPLAMAESSDRSSTGGTIGVLSREAGGHAIFLVTSQAMQKIALPGPATQLEATGDNGFAAHGDGALYLIKGDQVTTHTTTLKQSHYVATAGALFGLLDDGTPAVDDGKAPVRKLTNAENVKVSRLWLSPDNKLLIGYSPDGGELHIIDVATRSVVRALAVERPRTIEASRSFLFIRTAARGETLVITRTGLLEGKSVPPRWIAGGELPGANRDRLPIVATADGLASWIDPERNQIYIYHEGMNIPSTTLRLPDADTSDLKLIGPLVRSVGDGRFTAAATLENGGEYVAVVQSIEPRFTRCTTFKVEGVPIQQAAASRYFVKLVSAPTLVRPGSAAQVRFEISAGGRALAADTAQSVGILMLDMVGQTQLRSRAERQSDGTYLATFTPQREGVFMLLPDPTTFPGRVAGRPVATFEVKRP